MELFLIMVITIGIVLGAVYYGSKLEVYNNLRDEELANLSNEWLSRPGPVISE